MALTNHNMRLKMHYEKKYINENNLPMLLWAGYFCHSLYLLAVHLIGICLVNCVE